MQLSEMVAMMEQYKAAGGDWEALVSSVNVLSSANKTPLGLNQWAQSDKPVMADFNEDNRIIDENIRTLQAQKADQAAVYSKAETDAKVNAKLNVNGSSVMTADLKTTGVRVLHSTAENAPYAQVRFYEGDRNVASIVSDKKGCLILSIHNPEDATQYKQLRLNWGGTITWNGKRVLTE